VTNKNFKGKHSRHSHACIVPLSLACRSLLPQVRTAYLHATAAALDAARCFPPLPVSLPVAHRFLSIMFVLASWCRCRARVLPMPPCRLHLVLGGGRHAHGTRPPLPSRCPQLSLLLSCTRASTCHGRTWSRSQAPRSCSCTALGRWSC
jgi:hypothetical protein